MRPSLLPVLALLACNPIHAGEKLLAARSAEPDPRATVDDIPRSPLHAEPVALAPTALPITSPSAPTPSAPTPLAIPQSATPTSTTPISDGKVTLASYVPPTIAPRVVTPVRVAIIAVEPVKPVVEKTPTPTSPPVAAAAAMVAAHRLARGETLTRVAAQHQLDLSAFAAANSYTLDDHPLAGAKLLLTTTRPGRWTVRARQTASAIAAVCGITVAQLVAANDLADADEIRAGTVLVIPTQK